MIRAGTGVDRIVINAAINGVIAVTTIDQVVIVLTINRVVASTAVDDILTILRLKITLVVRNVQTIGIGRIKTAIDGVIPVSALDCIGAFAANDRIITGTAKDRVVVETTVKIVIVCATVDIIIIVATINGVVASPAVKRVLVIVGITIHTGRTIAAIRQTSFAANDHIIAVTAVDRVIAITTIEVIITTCAGDRIIATHAKEFIGVGVGGACAFVIETGERIVIFGADHPVDTARYGVVLCVTAGQGRCGQVDIHRCIRRGIVDVVLTCAALKCVCTLAADERIITFTTGKRVGAAAALQRVVARTAIDRIVATGPVDRVVTIIAVDHISPVGDLVTIGIRVSEHHVFAVVGSVDYAIARI